MFSKLKLFKYKVITLLLSLITRIFGNAVNNCFIEKILKHLGFRRDYDLPLNKSEDSRFLMLLIGLMSFLAILACSGIFALNAMTDRWSSGLENKVTIEISVETKEGYLLSNDTVQKETENLAKKLANNKQIKTIEVLTIDEIQELVSPWISDDLSLNNIPLPGLIAVELHDSTAQDLEELRADISNISDYAHLETHHEWLSDLIRFTNILKFLSLFIALIICSTTIIAIAAGIRTRLALHRKEVSLLHDMGATDNYISRQFQRHAMILSFKGSFIGTIAGLITTIFVIVISKQSPSSLIPEINLSIWAILFLCIIPLIASLISTLTARFTVLRSLEKMQ